jgi:hypothetical protein
VVLTRHPLAVWSSFVESFFDGDERVAHAWNPLLERYVPAVARFLREKPVPLLHVRYEELVADPAAELERICAFLGIPFEPGMVAYGESEAGARPAAAGLGDPTGVAREKRPTTASLARWTSALAGDPGKQAQAAEIVARLLDEDLETWGYDRKTLEAELAALEPGVARPRRPLTRYALERRLLVRLRRNIHHNAFGRLVRRVRDACDVLLR